MAPENARAMLRRAFGEAEFEHVRLEPDGDLLWAILDRPGRLNAMTDLMLREFKRIYGGIERSAWRCVIIAGNGRAFCSGADLGQFGSVVDVTDAAQVRDYIDTGWHWVIEKMREVPVPTVAAVHGPAYGGGANLALAADLVIAAESAVFCQSYIDRGISPDLGGTVLLPRLVGLQRARKQLLLGEPIGAAEALRMGMVCEVVPDAELRSRARAVASALAAKDPAALAITRGLIDQNYTLDIHTGLRNESLGLGRTLSSPVFAAATHRFSSEPTSRQ